jgi:hypothetical protein
VQIVLPLNTERLEELGITEVPDPVRPNERFYTSSINPDGTLSVEPKELNGVKRILKSAVAEYRFGVEVGGMVIGGSRIVTDRDAQLALTGAMVSFQSGFITEVDWKGSDGTWVRVNQQQLTPIAAAVAAHKQACFTAEKNHCDAIDAATTIQQLEEIDIYSNWPTYDQQ